MQTMMIMRYGKPIAKLSPIANRRNVAPMKKYAGKVKIGSGNLVISGEPETFFNDAVENYDQNVIS